MSFDSKPLYNRFGPCKDCQDRTIEPNCHAACDKFKEYTEKRLDEKKKYWKSINVDNMFKDYTDKTMRHFQKMQRKATAATINAREKHRSIIDLNEVEIKNDEG